jgi:hypothetical protein
MLDELWSDLVVAMLAVNNHSLEKTCAHLDGLKASGLCSPDNLSAWELTRLCSDSASRVQSRVTTST